VNSGLATTIGHSLAMNDSELYVGTWGGGLWRRPLREMLFAIGGHLFRDTNRDSVENNGEPGIPNRKIYLSIGSTVIDSVLTDSSGRFQFADIPPGSYIITRDSAAGSTHTYPPSPGMYNITLAEGGANPTGKVFGDAPPLLTFSDTLSARWNLVSLPLQ